MAHDPAAAQALCERYLLHARVEKRLAERTLSLYAIDLVSQLGEILLFCYQRKDYSHIF